MRGVVTVRTYVDIASGPVCAVTDTGIGIAKDDLTRIFDRFYRAENARRKTDVGSGLGLEIAKWIADAHCATLRVNSSLNHGSTFGVAFRSPLLASTNLDFVAREYFCETEIRRPHSVQG